MTGLLLKDLYTMWHAYRKNLILVVGLYLVLGLAMNMSFFLAFLSWMLGFYVIGLFSVDKASKWDAYANCLPVSRSQIVSAKYLLLLLCLAVGFSFGGVGSVLFYIVHGTPILESLLTVGVTSLLSLGLFGLTLTLSFKFGPEKARTSVMLVMAVLGASVAFLASTSAQTLDTLVIWLETRSFLLAFSGIAIPVLLYAISWVISIGIYEKLEF